MLRYSRALLTLLAVTSLLVSASPSMAATADPAPRLRISVAPATISTGQTSRVCVRTLRNERVNLYAYTLPNRTYRLVRTGAAANTLPCWDVRPGADTRLYASLAAGPASRNSPSIVIKVVRPRPVSHVPPVLGRSRNGICDPGEVCYYYNSNHAGSVSDFFSSVPDYGTSQPTCYEFRGPGAGRGLCVKNRAASVWNRSPGIVRVYFNSNFSGRFQDLAPGAKVNLSPGLKNNNASHQYRGLPPSVPPVVSVPPVNFCALNNSYEAVRRLLWNECVLPPLAATAPTLFRTPSGRVVRGRLNDDCSTAGFVNWPGVKQAVYGPAGNKDRPWFYDFTTACRAHDYGYQLIRENVLGRRARGNVDNVFKATLLDICRAYPGRSLPVAPSCTQVAWATWLAVTYIGWKDPGFGEPIGPVPGACGLPFPRSEPELVRQLRELLTGC